MKVTITIAIFLTVCTFGLLAQGGGAPPTNPQLLAKGTNYVVHAIPRMPPTHAATPPLVGGHVLVYTSVHTGKMTILTSSGILPFVTRRASWAQQRILGVVADSERLYVLLWLSQRNYDRPDWRITLPLQKVGGKYYLRVFSLADGSPVLTSTVGPRAEDLPKSVPGESMKQGPLVFHKPGISFFGRYFVFEGRKVIKNSYLHHEKELSNKSASGSRGRLPSPSSHRTGLADQHIRLFRTLSQGEQHLLSVVDRLGIRQPRMATLPRLPQRYHSLGKPGVRVCTVHPAHITLAPDALPTPCCCGSRILRYASPFQVPVQKPGTLTMVYDDHAQSPAKVSVIVWPATCRRSGTQIEVRFPGLSDTRSPVRCTPPASCPMYAA